MKRVWVAFFVILSLLVELQNAGSSFVRAYVGDQVRVAKYYAANPSHHHRFKAKKNLKQRRFVFQMDIAVAHHGAAIARHIEVNVPHRETDYGFNNIDRRLKDVPFSIFQPPRSA